MTRCLTLSMIRCLVLFLVLFLLSLEPGGLARAAETGSPPAFDEAMLKQIPVRMQQFVDEGRIAGAVTLVATRDRIVHLEAVGMADVAAGRPMRTDSIFRVASMTKPVTATALMQLIESRKVLGLSGWTSPVSKFIPAFANQKLKSGDRARPVTIATMLSHTAGLYRPSAAEAEGLTLEEIADLIGRQPLEFAPGSEWQYSSGPTVAGRLVELFSGESYADYLKAHIFEPLMMPDSAFQLTTEQVQRLATTYRPGTTPGSLEAVDIPDPTQARTPSPSGGLYSTAEDMARFYQSILNDGRLPGSDPATGESRLLKEATIHSMLAPQTGNQVTGFTPGNQWGLGWCVLTRPQGITRLLSPGTFGHGGAWGTQGWVDPERGLVLVLMIQRTGFGNSDGSEIRESFTELAIRSCRGPASPSAQFVTYHGYDRAIELRRRDRTGETDQELRAVLCPQAGGRVLEFSVGNRSALWLDEKEQAWKPGQPGMSSAGRFDFGPELVVARHPSVWSGEWTGEITGPFSARMISPRDTEGEVQVIRDFAIRAPLTHDPKVGLDRDADRDCWLECRQTVINLAASPRELCHWGRSFSPGGGVCLIPLSGQSRFPSKYAMYEDSAIINVASQDDHIRERDGFLEILGPPRKPKLGFDSFAGWLGYVLPEGGLFVKRWKTFPDRPYNEAAGLTLSVWYPEGARIELEPIGPKETLQPGEGFTFSEHWWLLDSPATPVGTDLDLPEIRRRVEQRTTIR